MEKKLQTIWEMAMSNPNGGTINPHTLQPITTGGWVIAVADTQNCFGHQGLKTAYDYAIQNNMNLGWWMDNGKMYWDANHGSRHRKGTPIKRKTPTVSHLQLRHRRTEIRDGAKAPSLYPLSIS